MPARIKADRAEFARLATDGASNADLAEHFGISNATVARLRATLGTPSPRTRRLTPEDHERIQAMLADGCPHLEIERTLGVSTESIQRYYPGTAWTIEQRVEHLAAVSRISGRDWNRPRQARRGKSFG